MVLIVSSDHEKKSVIRRKVQKSMLENHIAGTILFSHDLKNAKNIIKDQEEEVIIESLLILEVDDYEMISDFIDWVKYKVPQMKFYIQYNALIRQKLRGGMHHVYLSESMDQLIENLFIVNATGFIDDQLDKTNFATQVHHAPYFDRHQKSNGLLEKTLKSQLIMISGDVFNTYDLAHQISKKYKKSKYKRQGIKPRILCLDLDLLNPSFDQFFDVDYKIKTINSHLMPIDCTGINLIIDAYRKEVLSPQLLDELIYKHPDAKDIHYLFGNYNVANYEYYKWEEIYNIILWLSGQYDYIILHTSNNIYDEVTLHGMHVADQIYYCIHPFLHEVRNTTKLLMYISNKQKINYDKFKLLVTSSQLTTIDWSLLMDVDNPFPIVAMKKEKNHYYENYRSYYLKNGRSIQKQWQL